MPAAKRKSTRKKASLVPAKDRSLESWIWDAACSIGGAKDAPNGAERHRLPDRAAQRVRPESRIKYKDYILPLIFTKRLCDVFDDELNRIAVEVGSRKKAFALVKADPKLVRFYLPLVPDDPEQPVWSVIRKLSDQIGEGVTTHMRAIAKANPLLQGIIDRVDFNATTHGQRDLDDDRLSNLIEAISTKRLGLDDVEADIIGKSYEPSGARQTARQGSPKGERGGANQYLIRKFAEGGGQSAGEWSGATWTTRQGCPEGERGGVHQFYTPGQVGEIMARVLQPEPGMTVYDPCCGSGGLLVKLEIAMEEKEGGQSCPPPSQKGGQDCPPSKPAPLRLFGQEYVADTWAMACMNMNLHDMEGEIEIGDTFKNPKFRDQRGKLRTFDRVVATAPRDSASNPAKPDCRASRREDNPRWNQDWFTEADYDADTAERVSANIQPEGKLQSVPEGQDKLERFPAGAGFPGKSSADCPSLRSRPAETLRSAPEFEGAVSARQWGRVQHMHASLGDHGRAAVVLDTGAASRGSGNAGTNKEKTVRQWFVDHDLIESVQFDANTFFLPRTAH